MSDYLKNFINDNCIIRTPRGLYIKGSSDNVYYTWQFYLRRAIFYQPALHEIIKILIENHDDRFQYAAMESAGPPILAALKVYGYVYGKSVEGFAIRKEPKKYGIRNWFEGIYNPEKPVIIIDDIANSKSTIMRAKHICECHELAVVGAKTIINKSSRDNTVDGLPLESIYSISDFDLTWDEYYFNREEPCKEEFIKNFHPVLYTKTQDGYVELKDNI